MNEVARAMTSALKSNKWLRIEYRSTGSSGITKYWISIRDIEPKTRRICVDIFNSAYSLDCISSWIDFDRILSAQVIDLSTSDPVPDLIAKIEKNPQLYSFLHYEQFDNHILYYLEECARIDSDPYAKDYTMVEGIDLEVLKKRKRFPLNPEQTKSFVDCIFHNDIDLYETKSDEMALSLLSIDQGNKKYVVVYQAVRLDPKSKSLRLVGAPRVNPTFLIEGARHSLSYYTELSSDEFRALYEESPEKAKLALSEGLRPNEKIDTRPDFLLLERSLLVDFASLFAKIEIKQAEGRLNMPLRAFFGDISVRNNGCAIPDIVLYDKRVNLDQMLVIYDALKNPVTYVQGPPGTGKTQTLFNVIVSAYFEDHTVLISTNNNKPLDGIVEKLAFNYKYGPIPFPYLRLGNKEAVMEATKRIDAFVKAKFRGEPDEKKIDAIKRGATKKAQALVSSLTSYQQRKALLEELTFCKSVLENARSAKLEQRIKELEKSLEEISEVSEEDLLSLFSPASEDPAYLQYLYFSSLAHLKKLNEPRYAELRRIVSIEDDDNRVIAFNSWTKDDKNLRLLTDAFPIIFTTNVSSSKLGTGDFLFDLVIMDEAGQADIAHSLLAIARGESLLLVGDEDQLKPVTVVDGEVEAKLRDKYKVGEMYDYVSQSILSCMKSADKVSQRVLLRRHFRCGKKIIGYCNQYFYHGKLVCDPSLLPGEISFYNSSNKAKVDKANVCYEEAYGIVKYIIDAKLKDAIIITPFVNQANYLNELLDKAGIADVRAYTIHKVQGDQKKTIIMSCAVSQRTAERTAKWLEEHKEIVNVAVSRAQDRLVVFGDRDAMERLLSKDCAWNALISYAASNGETVVNAHEISQVTIGKSNGSISEDEFYATVRQLLSTKKALRLVERNQSAEETFPHDKSLKGSGFEFDQVIYEKTLFGYKPVLIFEFDGGEHYFDFKRQAADREKETICRRNGARLVRIGNDLSKDYEYLKIIIRKYAKNAEKEAEQILLF